MIQSIYTSVSNADIVPSYNKGQKISSEPIPLLRNNYLGEYRTELEKAKVRKNLGIADGQSLQWGNIEGFVEQQKDLVTYVEQKWLYTNEISEDIHNIKDALDYTIYFISNFKSDSESIIQLQKDVTEINETITSLEGSLTKAISDNVASIENLELEVEKINEAIVKLNEDLSTINVDANILTWVKNSLKNSKTVNISEDNTLDVIISKQSGNALQILEYKEAIEEDLENGIEAQEEVLPGIYIKDLTPEIQKNTEIITKVSTDQEALALDIQKNSETIESVFEELEGITIYQTDLSDDTEAPTTVGGVLQGTKVSKLKGKTINEILDTVLFPTTVRNLIYPTLYYSFGYQLVEVGSGISRPTLSFTQNDAGAELSRTETLTFQGSEVTGTSYDQLGTYEYQGSVSYNAGSYLIDNKGQTTDIRVEAGTISATASVETTYPWYAGNTTSITKQQLVPFNYPSGEITLSMDGQAVIKLPGANTTLNSFKVVGLGEGYIDVDMNSWTQTTTTENGITYKVWTKGDSYSALLSHKINFTLAL